MKYKVEYSKTNDTYRVMDGDKIVTDFATKERAEAETKRLNGLQSVKDVDKAQEKKSLKEKIQELSLDQKAKLYFMGLVRQGKIDTLPEDPKAAYIKMVMDKADPADMHDGLAQANSVYALRVLHNIITYHHQSPMEPYNSNMVTSD